MDMFLKLIDGCQKNSGLVTDRLMKFIDGHHLQRAIFIFGSIVFICASLLIVTAWLLAFYLHYNDFSLLEVWDTRPRWLLFGIIGDIIASLVMMLGSDVNYD